MNASDASQCSAALFAALLSDDALFAGVNFDRPAAYCISTEQISPHESFPNRYSPAAGSRRR